MEVRSLFALLFAIASATPVQITHQARIVDALGAPISQTLNLEVCIHTDPVVDTDTWCETFNNTAVAGDYVSLTLGSDTDNNPLQHTVFNQAAWVEVAVGGSAQLPRQPLASVPSAATATSVQGLVPSQLAAPGTYSTTLSACQWICTDSPGRLDCPGNKIVAGLAIYSTNGTSPCGNSDDHETLCCDLRVTIPGN